MRNLKKILALVLAMVMSLSLMATASAAESTAAAGDYALASKVLQGLDVVRGDDGGIREADSITRAEAAALAYRIHTADVKDTQANLYYDLQDAAFTDLAPVSAWALGYIGYAHNAQIVKGNGNGTFNPTGNITGYEILAMALRSIGYGKNGEFEGAEWQINTAAWARREGLLEGVTPADQVRLDLPATRGMVFQILFNAIQHADQQLSYVTGDLYIDATGANNTMALRLGLDKITGVVMANEWAALDADSVMAEGKTRLLAADNTSYTVDHSTELEDIGESRIVYIRDDKTVLDIADAGNTVKDNNGEETTVNSLKDSLNINDAEHFINFGYNTKDTSEWIIRYVIDAGYVVDGVWTAEPWYNVNNSWYTYLTGMTTTVGNKYASWTWSDAAKTQPLTVTVTIRPETQISATDKAIMKEIFYSADRYAANPDNDWVNYWVNGEVYVGTSSLEDKSDKMNWNDFWKTYVETDETQPITEAGNGEWLKIIDNNGDGKAEYVLLTRYVLDKVIDSTTKNDATTYYYNALDITKWTYKTHTGYEPKVGDIVLYALIDGTVQMQLADTATAAFRAVDYKERQAKTADGDTYEQSDISNETKLPSELVEVDENVEYTLYLDKYGYVRAYSNETRYALITEVYPTNGMNQAWVTDHSLTAEVMKTGEKTIKEYSIANNWYSNRYNPFYIGDNRSWNGALNTTRPNWLQPATHSLDWSVAEGNREFIFNNSATEVNHSWTNVAKYTPGSDEKSINLFTAADRTNGNRHEDYIQLAINNVSSKEPLYAINDVDYPNTTSNPNDHYVRAVDDTIFFVVSREDGRIGEVRQYVGYSNVVNLDVAKNGIHAMYAVAVNSNTDVDTNAHDYWTADVIVIEIEHFDDAFESVALIYSNDSKISGDVKYLQVLDSAKGYIGIIPNNYDIWRSQFNNYGFWGLKNIEATDDASIFTADIYPIHTASYTDHYALNTLCGDYGIGFGRVRSTNEELERSTYITVDVMGNENTNDVEKTTTIRLADKYGYAWSINDASTYYNEAGELIFGGHGSNRVNHGDYILWVNVPGTSNNTVGFIVDLSDKHVTSAHGWDNPDFLGSITARIAGEQNTTNNPVPDDVTITFDTDANTAVAIGGETVTETTVVEGTDVTFTVTAPDGYAVTVKDGEITVPVNAGTTNEYTVKADVSRTISVSAEAPVVDDGKVSITLSHVIGDETLDLDPASLPDQNVDADGYITVMKSELVGTEENPAVGFYVWSVAYNDVTYTGTASGEDVEYKIYVGSDRNVTLTVTVGTTEDDPNAGSEPVKPGDLGGFTPDARMARTLSSAQALETVTGTLQVAVVDGLKPVSVKTQYPTAASGRLVIVEEFTKGAKVGNQTADGKDMYWWNFKITVDKTLVVGNKVNVGIQFNTEEDKAEVPVEFGALTSKDNSIVQVKAGSVVDGKTADYNIIVSGVDYAIKSVVDTLTDTNETTVGISYKAYDAAGLDITSTSQAITTVRWLELTLRSASGEEKTVLVYREDTPANWPTTPERIREITVGDGISLNKDVAAMNDYTIVDGVVKVGQGTDPAVKMYFTADGRGTWKVALTASGETVSEGYSTAYYEGSNVSGLIIDAYDNLTITFTPDANPATLTLVADESVTEENTKLPTYSTIANNKNFTIEVINTHRPTVVCSDDTKTVTITGGAKGTAIGEVDTIKYTVSVENMGTASATLTLSVAPVGNVEDEMGPVEGGDPGNDPATNVSYQVAYEAAGISVSGEGTVADVTVDGGKLVNFLTNHNVADDPLFQTLRINGGTGNMLAAGATFTAPENATKVKICYNGSATAPTDSWTDATKNTEGRDTFDNDGVHLYIAVTTEGRNSTQQGREGEPSAILTDISPTYANRTKYVWLQFEDNYGALGDPVLCTIRLSWKNVV